METVFKVVYREDGRLYSVFAGRPLEREYKEGEWTKGYKGTPVLAFSDRATAERWGRGTNREVWLAEAQEPAALDVVCSLMNPLNILAFWKLYTGAPLATAPLTSAPDNTVACQAIRLVERVA